jgi:hypothetical protein
MSALGLTDITTIASTSTAINGTAASASAAAAVAGDEIAGQRSSQGSVFGGLEIPLHKNWNVVAEAGTKNTEFPHSEFPWSLSLHLQGEHTSFSIGAMRQGITGDASIFSHLGRAF